MITAEFYEGKRNSLFFILIESGKEGQLILDQYRKSAIVDIHRLRNVIKNHFVYKDPVNY